MVQPYLLYIKNGKRHEGGYLFLNNYINMDAIEELRVFYSAQNSLGSGTMRSLWVNMDVPKPSSFRRANLLRWVIFSMGKLYGT